MFSKECMKNYFKEEQLSDRILRIVEIKEVLSENSKYKLCLGTTNLKVRWSAFFWNLLQSFLIESIMTQSKAK